MNAVRKFWKSVKRNPVLNFFVLTAAGQFAQDYITGNIDWSHFTGYVATVLIGVIARMFTVPVNEHEELKGQVGKAIANLAAQHQNAINQAYMRGITTPKATPVNEEGGL